MCACVFCFVDLLVFAILQVHNIKNEFALCGLVADLLAFTNALPYLRSPARIVVERYSIGTIGAEGGYFLFAAGCCSHLSQPIMHMYEDAFVFL